MTIKTASQNSSCENLFTESMEILLELSKQSSLKPGIKSELRLRASAIEAAISEFVKCARYYNAMFDKQEILAMKPEIAALHASLKALLAKIEAA